MARSKSREVAVVEDSSVAKVQAKVLSDVLVLAPPWTVAAAAIVVVDVLHRQWDGSVWAAVGLLPSTGLLTGLAWWFSHHRSLLARVQVTATTAAAGMWASAGVVYGPLGGPRMSYVTVVGTITIAVAWNMRRAIRADGAGRTDTLGLLFEDKAETVGLGGARLHTLTKAAHKLAAKLHLVPGEKIAEDVQKKTAYIEAALELPPGSVTTTPDMDRADLVDVTISDPRIMRNPIPWPGPSRPGGSIAEPIRPGLFQDLDEVELVLPGSHLQVMGKSGAGKSIGCAWNTLAEVVTRRDVAVFAIDLVKGEQTLGALRPALHRFETDLEGAKDLLAAVAGHIPHRTSLLAAKGHTKWREGCGIPYWVLWIEEAWKLFDLVDMDAFEELLKALRSAGGTVVFSLQRSDHSQVPTIVRGQSSFWTFGVQTSKDADFGLSEEQSEAGARPELWGHNYPGMSVIDAPSIPRDRIAMAIRTFDWADDMGALRKLAEQYPAAAKPADALTAELARFSDGPEGAPAVGDAGGQEEGVDVTEQYIKGEDPDPDITARVDADSPIEDAPDDRPFEFKRHRRAGKVSAVEARKALLGQLDAWAEEGRDRFSTRDLRPVWEASGWSRAWIVGQIKQLIEEGVVEHDDDGGYRLLRVP